MEKRNLTRYRLSQDLEISPQTACNWADGKNLPDTQSILKLSEYFGVTVEQLMK
ncbi:helix-turn-helix transcriptional regulator [Subdoligranulum sp. DSM 109015]|uniref:Helix-turn-helix transcriptional regulator n=2 Tax=Gemmiger gallinarum TaxID=2779354 RepID=A0ABR9R2E6_9FIRM|nr:helix-turn-helix transcriptional regulator [Gemmiger gallinarum]